MTCLGVLNKRRTRKWQWNKFEGGRKNRNVNYSAFPYNANAFEYLPRIFVSRPLIGSWCSTIHGPHDTCSFFIVPHWNYYRFTVVFDFYRRCRQSFPSLGIDVNMWFNTHITQFMQWYFSCKKIKIDVKTKKSIFYK